MARSPRKRLLSSAAWLIPCLFMGCASKEASTLRPPTSEASTIVDHVWQSKDFVIASYDKGYDFKGVVRLQGYTSRALGAAHRDEDTLEFVVTTSSKEVESILLNKRHEKRDEQTNEIVITLAVPHDYDPGQIVRASTIADQVLVVVNILGSFDRGGVDNTNQLLMFQKKSSLDIEFIDPYTDSDYEHFYDGL